MDNHPELPEQLRRLKERGDGFTGPDADYFDALATRSLRAAGQRPATRRTRFRRLRPLLAVAAALLLLLTAGWWVARSPSPAAPAPSSDELLAEISDETIEWYVDEHLEEFDLEQLLTYPTE